MALKEEDTDKEKFMRKISILLLFVLASCTTLKSDREEIKKIGHDAVDEGIDKVIKKVESTRQAIETELNKDEKEISNRKSS